MKRIDLSLSNILESIMLNEDSNLKDFRDNKDIINYAIDNKLYISLYYDDGKPISKKNRRKVYGNPKGFRRIIPYCLGSRKGRLALRAFHQWKTNTKRGPFKWKFFYLDRMSNVRVYKNMKITAIPELANPEGDAHMDKIINILDLFQSPREREQERWQEVQNAKPEDAVKALNKQGYITLTNKGGLNSVQNLRPIPSKTKKVQYNFQNTAKNLDDTNKERNWNDYWAEYDKAAKEAQGIESRRAEQELIKQAEAPNPPTSKSGPVNQRIKNNDNEEGYEE
jgi:hypothetical protein